VTQSGLEQITYSLTCKGLHSDTYSLHLQHYRLSNKNILKLGNDVRVCRRTRFNVATQMMQRVDRFHIAILKVGRRRIRTQPGPPALLKYVID